MSENPYGGGYGNYHAQPLPPHRQDSPKWPVVLVVIAGIVLLCTATWAALRLTGNKDRQADTTAQATSASSDTEVKAQDLAPELNPTQNSSSSSTSAAASSVGTGQPPRSAAASQKTENRQPSSKSQPSASSSVSRAPAGITQTVKQEFDAWGAGALSPDGLWRLAGDWRATGGNLMQRANATVNNGVLSLTSKANTKQGAEIQTMRPSGYGYYSTRMKVAKVAGVCQSFFWIEGGGLNGAGYGPGEIDFEFLTNEPWLNTNRGRVHLALHPGAGTPAVVELPFNPADGFHTYGFLWTPKGITYVIDGKVVRKVTTLPASLTGGPKTGVIMANTWTGNPNWGGGPPKRDATAQYEWMHHYPGATSIPKE